MYQPSHHAFEVADPAALLAEVVIDHPATLVSVGGTGFEVSILPMVYRPGPGPDASLLGHLARPNPQWRSFETETPALAIFNGPDAYVSPAWYPEKRRTGKVVPTWNYVTLVAHGLVTVHHDPEWLLAHLRTLVDRHEGSRATPWSIDDAPAGYIEGQARAIVGLEFRITRLEAKRKLSQNRRPEDVEGVIAGLEDGSASERAVAEEMSRSGRAASIG